MRRDGVWRDALGGELLLPAKREEDRDRMDEDVLDSNSPRRIGGQSTLAQQAREQLRPIPRGPVDAERPWSETQCLSQHVAHEPVRGFGAEHAVADPIGGISFTLERAEAPIAEKAIERPVHLEIGVQVDAAVLVDRRQPCDIGDRCPPAPAIRLLNEGYAEIDVALVPANHLVGWIGPPPRFDVGALLVRKRTTNPDIVDHLSSTLAIWLRSCGVTERVGDALAQCGLEFLHF